MKATYKSANGRLLFEVLGETTKDLFAGVANLQEVFDAEESCGCCNQTDIRYSHRTVDDYQFYELVCRACGAQFQFGQKKKGGALFPKRKAEDGSYLPNGGWAKFSGKAIAERSVSDASESGSTPALRTR